MESYLITEHGSKKPKHKAPVSESESSKISATAMERIVDDLKNRQHRSTTRDFYHKVWCNFNEFIIKLDVIPPRWEERTALYCGYLIEIQNLQSSTVRSYISAIKSVLSNDGYTWDREFALLSALTRACKLNNDTVKSRFPIRKGVLNLMMFRIQIRYANQPYLECMYKSLYLVAYYGLFRVGELTLGPHVLKAKDVHEGRNKDKILMILHTSKTHGKGNRPQKIKLKRLNSMEVSDQDTKPQEVHYPSQDKSTNQYCPVKHTIDYIQMRQARANDDEQFYIFSDGSPVRPCHMRSILRELLQALGLEGALYDTHSFRSGRASDLFHAGVDVELIKYIGRWKSNAIYKYLHD